MEIILRGIPLIPPKWNFILDHWGLWDTVFIAAICCSSLF